MRASRHFVELESVSSSVKTGLRGRLAACNAHVEERFVNTITIDSRLPFVQLDASIFNTLLFLKTVTFIIGNTASLHVP